MDIKKRIGIFVITLSIIGCAYQAVNTDSGGKYPEVSLKPVFQKAVEDLARQISEKGMEKLKVYNGQYTYADSKIASGFSAFLSAELSLALIESPYFEEITRGELSQITEEYRLILSGFIDSSDEIEMGQIKGMDAILTGKFWEQGDDIKVNLFLIKIETGHKIAAASLDIPRYSMPGDLALRPTNYRESQESIKTWDEAKGSAVDFSVKVWVDKGKGGVYREGEDITIYFKSDKDCHLRLYHTSVEGEIRLIFPNLYERDDYIKAGRVYSIPDEKSTFKFKVSPPFGAETIKAVASLQAFPSENTNSSSGAFRSLGAATPNNIRGIITRGIAVVPSEARTDDTCVFTTISR